MNDRLSSIKSKHVCIKKMHINKRNIYPDKRKSVQCH